MTTTKAKSKKAASDICSEISNKISTREAFSVVETTRQNVLEVFFLPSNRNKLLLVTIEATSSSLAGFLPVKVPSKKHTWVSPSVASTPTKSPKVFNNRPVNKLVFPSIDSTLGVANTTSSKKWLKRPKVQRSGDNLQSIIWHSSGRSLLVLEAKQSPSVESPVLENWTNQIETDSSSLLISSTASGDVASTLVSGATFKIKLAYVKTVFQSIHGFLSAKSVLKDNVKLFYVEFVSQVFLKAVFLVELTSSVHLASLKIAKSLIISESGSLFAAVVLCDMPLGMSAADIKTALSVFGSVTCVVLKPAGVWQYVVVYFKKLDSAVSALNHWSVLVDKDSIRILSLAKLVNLPSGCTVFEISDMISQVGGQFCFIPQFSDSGHHFRFALVMFGSQADLDLAVVKTGILRKCCIWWKTPDCQHCFWCQETGHLVVDCKVALSPFLKAPKMFKPCFVGSLSYAKASAPSVMSEFPSLVASASSVAIVDPAQISDLAALVKSIVKPVGSLVVLVSCLFDNNAVKAVQIEKDLLSMKYASNNFASFMVGVSKNIACLRSEVDFGGMDYDDIQATKPSLLSENTVEHVIALW
ncbi:hypothetical protein G9A89_003967 [Geosiphon pyriformis]|nr:hypothetical protein G9A89_003967 [Geosiphon pyriformis]